MTREEVVRSYRIDLDNKKDGVDIFTNPKGLFVPGKNDLITTAIQTMVPAITKAPFTPKSIELSADHMTVVVIWRDGAKTIVKRSPNDPDDIYMAFTAALAKRVFGSNSHIKKIIRDHLNEHEPRHKKGENND